MISIICIMDVYLGNAFPFRRQIARLSNCQYKKGHTTCNIMCMNLWIGASIKNGKYRQLLRTVKLLAHLIIHYTVGNYLSSQKEFRSHRDSLILVYMHLMFYCPNNLLFRPQFVLSHQLILLLQLLLVDQLSGLSDYFTLTQPMNIVLLLLHLPLRCAQL